MRVEKFSKTFISQITYNCTFGNNICLFDQLFDTNVKVLIPLGDMLLLGNGYEGVCMSFRLAVEFLSQLHLSYD